MTQQSDPTSPSELDATQTADLPVATLHVESAKPDCLVVMIHHTEYQLHLVPESPVDHLKHHQRIKGVISAKAQRVDQAAAGGKYIEPLYGRPRRIQGRVVGTVVLSDGASRCKVGFFPRES